MYSLSEETEVSLENGCNSRGVPSVPLAFSAAIFHRRYICVYIHSPGPNLISCFDLSLSLSLSLTFSHRYIHSHLLSQSTPLLTPNPQAPSSSSLILPLLSPGVIVVLIRSPPPPVPVSLLCLHRTTPTGSHRHTSLMFTGCGGAYRTHSRVHRHKVLKSSCNRNADISCALSSRVCRS